MVHLFWESFKEFTNFLPKSLYKQTQKNRLILHAQLRSKQTSRDY